MLKDLTGLRELVLREMCHSISHLSSPTGSIFTSLVAMLTSQSFSVWAPLPHDVHLILNGETLPMHKTEGSWWRAEIAPKAGDRYGFRFSTAPPGQKPSPIPLHISTRRGSWFK